MGWLYMYEPREGRKAYLDNQMTWTRESLTGDLVKSRVLDSGIVRFRTYYAAVEQVIDNDPSTRTVFAVVCLLSTRPHDRLQFGYKDMDETMGPCESECPERILKLLTSTDSKWANAWRKRCWELVDQRKWRKKLKPGDLFLFHDRTYKLVEKTAYMMLVTEPSETVGMYRLLPRTYAHMKPIGKNGE